MQLAKRDGLKCHWCGQELRLEGHRKPDGNFATLDHVNVRKCDGGLFTVENCVLACRKCNEGRPQQVG